MIEFKHFSEQYYEALRVFFIELNCEKKLHINWNWARFEWMYEHPEFDKSSKECMGIWLEGSRIVGAAVYDMYFGEGFCGVLNGYEQLYSEVLCYAYDNLKDDSGFGIAICDDNTQEIELAEECGFEPVEQTENIMKISLEKELEYQLPNGIRIEDFDPRKEAYRFQWLLWQGFDHGCDKEEFERNDAIIPQMRPNLIRELSVAAVDEQGNDAAYCCVWYDKNTDYAYVEPVCTVPSYRGMGIGKAAVYEALNRAGRLGAKSAYVISDQSFYQKLGFENELHFTFYWKKA